MLRGCRPLAACPCPSGHTRPSHRAPTSSQARPPTAWGPAGAERGACGSEGRWLLTLWAYTSQTCSSFTGLPRCFQHPPCPWPGPGAQMLAEGMPEGPPASPSLHLDILPPAPTFSVSTQEADPPHPPCLCTSWGPHPWRGSPPPPPPATQTMGILLSKGRGPVRARSPTTQPAWPALPWLQLALPRLTARRAPGVHLGLDTWPEAPRVNIACPQPLPHPGGPAARVPQPHPPPARAARGVPSPGGPALPHAALSTVSRLGIRPRWRKAGNMMRSQVRPPWLCRLPSWELPAAQGPCLSHPRPSAGGQE